jgi:hypothetical protein
LAPCGRKTFPKLASNGVAGCRRVLSEELIHGQAIDGVTIENPFR